MAWPLPLYETALMTAALGREHQLRLTLTLVTGEAAPLQVFGDRASAELRSLLERHDIELLTARRCQVPAADRVVVLGEHAGETRELAVDRAVALPELIGPHLRGLPSAPHGFIPIDHLCRVPGLGGVYAAGDGTDYPVKHGAIAAQQAQVAARCIAAAAGADIEPHPFHPTLSGMLLTGGTPRYLTARLVAAHPFRSTAAVMPDAEPDAPTKVRGTVPERRAGRDRPMSPSAKRRRSPCPRLPQPTRRRSACKPSASVAVRSRSSTTCRSPWPAAASPACSDRAAAARPR